MKLLSWIFNLESRHFRDIRNYQKGKVGTRIFCIILVLILVGASLAVEYTALDMFKTNALNAIVLIILLFLPLVATSIEYCTLYCYLGFKMFFLGSLESIILKVEQKKKKKQQTPEAQEISQEQAPEQAAPKPHKVLDLLVALVSLISGIALIVLLIAMISING